MAAGFRVTTHSGAAPVSGNGTTLTTVTDLLGRVISSTDAWSTVTATTYTAQAGRVGQVTTTPPGGTATAVKFGYDDDGKVLTVKDGADALLAPVDYDDDEQFASVVYGSSGNSPNRVAEVHRHADGLRDAERRRFGPRFDGGLVEARSARRLEHYPSPSQVEKVAEPRAHCRQASERYRTSDCGQSVA